MHRPCTPAVLLTTFLFLFLSSFAFAVPVKRATLASLLKSKENPPPPFLSRHGGSVQNEEGTFWHNWDRAHPQQKDSYLLCTLRRSASLAELSSFVGHSDVHLMTSESDRTGSSNPMAVGNRFAIVFHHSKRNWLRRHYREVGTGRSPCTSVDVIPQELSPHLSAELLTLLEENPSSNCPLATMDADVLPTTTVAMKFAVHISFAEHVTATQWSDELTALNTTLQRRRSHCILLPRSTEGDTFENPNSHVNIALLRRRNAQQQSMTERDVFRCCHEAFDGLSSLGVVRWVEPAVVYGSVTNQVAVGSLQSPLADANNIHRRPIWEAGITGAGQVLHVGDTGLDVDSCFVRDEKQAVSFYPEKNVRHRKILSYEQCVDDDGHLADGDGRGYHGTHVIGSAVGNDLTGVASQYNGMAKDAKVVVRDMTCGSTASTNVYIPSDMTEYYYAGYALGAGVSSSSWGTRKPARYSILEKTTDRFLYNHQHRMLSVFASGNFGSAGVLNPATSKNVLTVGAHPNTAMAAARNTVSSFSSKGPTYDGRTKPDLCAPGDPILSALSDGIKNSNQCTVSSKSGTSMACPHVAGSAVLLRQYLEEGFYPSGTARSEDAIPHPTSALLKAMLVQATIPMTGVTDSSSKKLPVPNPIEGYGRLELDKVMWFQPSSPFSNERPFQFLVNDAILQQEGDYHEYCFTMAATDELIQQQPVKMMRATLTWMDPAYAAEGAATSMINNLDLAVVAADGTVFYGNDVKGFDHLNNVEQVTIHEQLRLGTPPKFRVVVHATHLVAPGPSDPRQWTIDEYVKSATDRSQSYALAIWAPLLRQVSCVAETGTVLRCPNDCSGIGTCDPQTGRCSCPLSHSHIDCSLCNGTTVCHDNGHCSMAKVCTCDAAGGHFDVQAAPDCSVCLPNWYGPHCNSNCTCGAGVCDTTTGSCVCPKVPAQDTSVVLQARTLLPDIRSTYAESCYDGGQCERCCEDHGGPMCSMESAWCQNWNVRHINGTALMIRRLEAIVKGERRVSLEEYLDQADNTGTVLLLQVNGAAQYENSLLCQWSFSAPLAEQSDTPWRVRLTFVEFEVEDKYDYIRIVEGADLLGDQSQGEYYSGKSAAGKRYVSQQPFLSLSFVSDLVHPEKGFLAQLSFERASAHSTSTPASSTTTTTITTTTPTTTTTPQPSTEAPATTPPSSSAPISSSCPQGCGAGTCVEGLCRCPAGQSGHHCQIPLLDMTTVLPSLMKRPLHSAARIAGSPFYVPFALVTTPAIDPAVLVPTRVRLWVLRSDASAIVHLTVWPSWDAVGEARARLSSPLSSNESCRCLEYTAPRIGKNLSFIAEVQLINGSLTDGVTMLIAQEETLVGFDSAWMYNETVAFQSCDAWLASSITVAPTTMIEVPPSEEQPLYMSVWYVLLALLAGLVVGAGVIIALVIRHRSKKRGFGLAVTVDEDDDEAAAEGEMSRRRRAKKSRTNQGSVLAKNDIPDTTSDEDEEEGADGWNFQNQPSAMMSSVAPALQMRRVISPPSLPGVSRKEVPQRALDLDEMDA